MSKRYIYLIRHGETDNSSLGKGRFYIGHKDLELSLDGMKNAKSLVKTVKLLNFTDIYSSDLKRAQKTAQILGDACITKPIYLKEFREINLGQWEGISVEYIKSKFPDLYKQRGENLGSFITPDGESFNDFFDRIWTAFNKLVSETSGNIVLVSHAGVNRAIICKILSIPVENQFKIEQAYCCINAVSIKNNKFKVEMINYHTNLFKSTNEMASD